MPSGLFDVVMTVVMDAILFVRRFYDRCDRCYLICPTFQWPPWWVISDLSNVTVTVVIVWPYLLVPRRIRPKDVIFWALFSDDLTFWLDRPCRLVFRVSPIPSFGVLLQIERLILTLGRLFDNEQYLTRWKNVTVNYALVRCSCKLCMMVLRVLWM